ncbi:MAG: zf-HC2 domain-containing protein [Deltaproteobacteria bacterium]|nr:zf-HC2 domain-containing protein [Deltaproteobacteria bacterium]
MTEHERFQAILSDYLDGELSEQDCDQLEAHLAECDACSHQLALLRRALQVVHDLPQVRAPAHFASRLRRRARRSGLLSRRRRKALWRMSMPFSSTMVMSVLLASVGALLIVVFMLQKQIELLIEHQPPPRLQVSSIQEMEELARAIWDCGGRVGLAGHSLDAASPLGDAWELDLEIPRTAWRDFQLALERLDLHAQLDPEPPTGTGAIHLLVQRMPPGEPARQPD